MKGDRAQSPGERKRHHIAIRTGEVRTGLVDPDVAHLLKNPQPGEDRQVTRQQRFTDVKPRVTVLFEQSDAPPPLRQQRCRGSTCGPTPDHENIHTLHRIEKRPLQNHSQLACIENEMAIHDNKQDPPTTDSYGTNRRTTGNGKTDHRHPQHR